jgi:hypothetical protein
VPIHETGYHWFRINDETGYNQFRSIVGADSRNWVSSAQKYCGCRFRKLGIVGSELMMKLSIISSEVMWVPIQETGYHRFRSN